MPIIPPGFADCAVEIVHTALARPAYVTFGVAVPGGTTDPDVIAEDVATAFTAPNSMSDRLDTGCTVTTVTCRVGQDAGDPRIGVFAPNKAGVGLANAVPVNVAALIHKRTNFGGRRGRGRIFMPWCLDDTEVDEGGAIGVAARADLQANADVFLNVFALGGYSMVVLHSPGQSSASVPFPVTSLTVDPRVSTQRRRLGR